MWQATDPAALGPCLSGAHVHVGFMKSKARYPHKSRSCSSQSDLAHAEPGPGPARVAPHALHDDNSCESHAGQHLGVTLVATLRFA